MAPITEANDMKRTWLSTMQIGNYTVEIEAIYTPLCMHMKALLGIGKSQIEGVICLLTLRKSGIAVGTTVAHLQSVMTMYLGFLLHVKSFWLLVYVHPILCYSTFVSQY
ncbi:hypothetical protein DFH28DRAFT_932139 [Melampsora americana]|nr:hypothetical protein DFH28DRAFT_932139 [Melampsora americana]